MMLKDHRQHDSFLSQEKEGIHADLADCGFNRFRRIGAVGGGEDDTQAVFKSFFRTIDKRHHLVRNSIAVVQQEESRVPLKRPSQIILHSAHHQHCRVLRTLEPGQLPQKGLVLFLLFESIFIFFLVLKILCLWRRR